MSAQGMEAVKAWAEATEDFPRSIEFEFRPLGHWPWSCKLRSGRKRSGREAVGRTPDEAFETARAGRKVPDITETEDAELTAELMERAKTNRRMP